MPIRNANGQLIQERTLTKEEQYIHGLKYPEHFTMIRKLTVKQFRKWLYGLEPREAMILACDKPFKMFQEMKLSKWRFIWRLIWE